LLSSANEWKAVSVFQAQGEEMVQPNYSDLHLKEYSNMLLQPSHEQRKLNHQGGIVIYFSLLP
jgi:hypothetical protein